MTNFLLEGDDLEALLLRAHREGGAAARIVRAEKVRRGGVLGFFARERFEVAVEVPATPDETAADMPDRTDGAAVDRLAGVPARIAAGLVGTATATAPPATNRLVPVGWAHDGGAAGAGPGAHARPARTTPVPVAVDVDAVDVVEVGKVEVGGIRIDAAPAGAARTSAGHDLKERVVEALVVETLIADGTRAPAPPGRPFAASSFHRLVTPASGADPGADHVRIMSGFPVITLNGADRAADLPDVTDPLAASDRPAADERARAAGSDGWSDPDAQADTGANPDPGGSAAPDAGWGASGWSGPDTSNDPARPAAASGWDEDPDAAPVPRLAEPVLRWPQLAPEIIRVDDDPDAEQQYAEQAYADQQHAEQAYAEQPGAEPYAEQPRAEQPYPEQPYAGGYPAATDDAAATDLPAGDGYPSDTYTTDAYATDGYPSDSYATGSYATEGYTTEGYPSDSYGGYLAGDDGYPALPENPTLHEDPAPTDYPALNDYPALAENPAPAESAAAEDAAIADGAVVLPTDDMSDTSDATWPGLVTESDLDAQQPGSTELMPAPPVAQAGAQVAAPAPEPAEPTEPNGLSTHPYQGSHREPAPVQQPEVAADVIPVAVVPDDAGPAQPVEDANRSQHAVEYVSGPNFGHEEPAENRMPAPHNLPVDLMARATTVVPKGRGRRFLPGPRATPSPSPVLPPAPEPTPEESGAAGEAAWQPADPVVPDAAEPLPGGQVGSGSAVHPYPAPGPVVDLASAGTAVAGPAPVSATDPGSEATTMVVRMPADSTPVGGDSPAPMRPTTDAGTQAPASGWSSEISALLTTAATEGVPGRADRSAGSSRPVEQDAPSADDATASDVTANHATSTNDGEGMVGDDDETADGDSAWGLLRRWRSGRRRPEADAVLPQIDDATSSETGPVPAVPFAGPAVPLAAMIPSQPGPTPGKHRPTSTSEPVAAAAPLGPMQHKSHGLITDGDNLLADRQALRELGVPVAYTDRLQPGDRFSAVVAMLAGLPEPAITADAAVIAVVGPAHVVELEAARTALDLPAGGRPRAVTLVPGSTGVDRRAALARSERIRPVVVSIPIDGYDDPAGAAAALDGVQADAVIAVIDPTRPMAEIAAWIGAFGRIDAIAVDGALDAGRPAEVLGLGIPVIRLDGIGVDRISWAALLCAQMSAGAAPTDATVR